VAGDELVRRFFKHYFNDELRDRVEIIARYPENVSDHPLLSKPSPPHQQHLSHPGQAIVGLTIFDACCCKLLPLLCSPPPSLVAFSV